MLLCFSQKLISKTQGESANYWCRKSHIPKAGFLVAGAQPWVAPSRHDTHDRGEGVEQCFSTGVPRNPRVPWASYKGSGMIGLFHFDLSIAMFLNRGSVGIHIGFRSHCEWLSIVQKDWLFYMFSKFLIDFNWKDGNNIPFCLVKSCQTMSA